MDDLASSCDEELGRSFFNSIKKAIPLTTLLELTGAGSEAETKKLFMQNAGFKKLVKDYQDHFENSK
ncbi:MAG: hypothetical protein GXP45_05630 [bacterium]|nr:hypothetical protein [bacterium]